MTLVLSDYTVLYRNDVQCRDKWMNGLDPTLNHNPQFAEIEDKMLLHLVPIFGLGKLLLLKVY